MPLYEYDCEDCGERFETLEHVPARRGRELVRTRLVPGDTDVEPVALDYLMAERGGRWRVIDIYLEGTISELALRRSEFAAVLSQGGGAALIAMLGKKAADLAKPRPAN